ncbi:phosphatidylethanolamine-binding protein [Chiua virens]|nr:phosphatidylethanolamine-binding protein [Chiua virens]
MECISKRNITKGLDLSVLFNLHEMLSFKLFRLIFVLCSVSAASAQPNSTTVQIAAIQAHFNQSGLVPTVLRSFTPTAYLAVSFQGTGKIAIETLYQPDLTVTAANASTALRGTYTVMMVDAGPPGADQSHGQRRHWLLNGASIPGSVNANVSSVGAMAVTRYIPPNPPVGDGPHRYTILVFAQPADFLPPVDLSQENTGGGTFVVEEYVRYTRLGALVARGPAYGFCPTDKRGGFLDTSWVERSSSANRRNGTESKLGTERNT